MTRDLFTDQDKRRAALLSLLLHLFVLLLLVWLWTIPPAPPQETYLVIDIGTPALAEEPTLAPTADAPAPQAAEPLVEADSMGQPRAESPPEPAPAAPDAPEVPVEIPSEAAQARVPESSVQLPTPPLTRVPELLEPELLTETVAPPVEPVFEEPVSEPSEPLEATPDTITEIPPPPAVAEPASPAIPVPQSTVTTTTLPEIEQEELSPQPLAQALPIPQPASEAVVLPSQSIAVNPTVQVTQERPIPSPQATVSTAEARPIPQPQASTEVTVSQSVPTPQATSEVSEARSIPTPQVTATATQAQRIPQPQVSSQVSEAQNVPVPQATASASEAQAIPQPQVSTNVREAQNVPTPEVAASVSQGQAVTVTPQVSVSAAAPIPAPQVEASEVQPQSGSGAAEATSPSSDAPEGPAITAGIATPQEDGGNADRSGQTTDQPDASPENLGLAAGPDGSDTPTGAPFARVPYSENRDRPLNVIIDNALGYPQLGLLEASMIFEMPVEGGQTRLMTVYDRVDPSRVGPVRSAREYFHEVSRSMDGILVHDGGSPAALVAIGNSSVPSINSFSSGDLFSRDGGRSAPYNLYSQGGSLRQALARLNLNRSRVVSGTIYRPDTDTETASRVNVTYSGIYDSGFRYVQELNLYRWVRNNADASDALGEAVYVDAVLIATIDAQAIPGDPEGRLYIPLRGGRATLYLRGQVIPGRWDISGGLRFTSSLGEVVSLTPFKTWIAFVPDYARIAVD